MIGGAKYELVTRMLKEGDVMGFETNRARSQLVFVAEEDTLVLEIPPPVFESLFKPILLARLEKKLSFLRDLPCFKE